MAVFVGSAPPVAAAGDQLQDSSVKTYELDPGKHVIRVTDTFTFTNNKANYYYYAHQGWLEADARRARIKASSGTVSLKLGKTKGDWRKFRFKYSPLNTGQKRTFTMSYELPAAGPREAADRTAMAIRADFCAAGPGTDAGELRIVVPKGFRLSGTDGMTSTTKRGVTTYSSGWVTRKPWALWKCVSGDNSEAFTATDASAAGGLPVTIAGWKDDPAWNKAVTTAVGTAQQVAGVLGVAEDQQPITVRETRATGPTASMNGLGDTLSVSHQDLDPAHIADALIHGTWFPTATWEHGWLQGGYELWAMDQAGVGTVPCDAPGAYPGSGDPGLTTWGLPASATATEAAVWAWKQQAACSIVAQVNQAIGPDRTAAVWTAVNEGWDAWSPASAPAQRAGQAIDWATWLDIVTERGLVPAGSDADLAANLLLEYGVTVDAELMAERAGARAALAAFEESTGHEAPAFIDDAMHAWEYAAASRGLETATSALATAAETEAVLPDAQVAGGIVETAVTGAKTQADLDAASTLAATQLAAAKDVADAQAVLATPLDAVQQVGLAGSSVPVDDVAVAAVVAGDAEGAAAEANAIRDALGGARDTGVQRLAIGGGVVVLVVVLLVILAVVVRRRSGSGRAMAEPPVPPATPGA